MTDGIIPVEHAVVVPTEPTENILDKIDRLIAERQPAIIEKMREIRQGEGLVFRGMTREQISERFKIVFAGDETWAQLRNKVSLVNDRRLEANGYMRDLEIEYDMITSYLEQFKNNLNQEIIASNLASKKNDKISDKAREALTSKIFNTENIGDHIAWNHTWMAYWKSIIQDLDHVFDMISQNMQALASEFKWSQLAGVTSSTPNRP
jgi:hypothetical protein